MASYRIEFFRNKKHERQCRVVHKNGNEIMRTATGYKRLNKAVRSIKRFLDALKKGDYEFDVKVVPLGRPKK